MIQSWSSLYNFFSFPLHFWGFLWTTYSITSALIWEGLPFHPSTKSNILPLLLGVQAGRLAVSNEFEG